MGAEFPHLLEVSERLQENVAQLHRSVCLFMGHAWRQVLTPVQAGTFMVQAFPWTPDMLALANTIAEEAGAHVGPAWPRDHLASEFSEASTSASRYAHRVEARRIVG